MQASINIIKTAMEQKGIKTVLMEMSEDETGIERRPGLVINPDGSWHLVGFCGWLVYMYFNICGYFWYIIL